MEKTKIEQKMKLPKGVKVHIDDNMITVEGPKGKIERKVMMIGLKHKIEGDNLTIFTEGKTKKDKKMLFTYVAHIQNMLKGAEHGHKYILKICSGHFPMNVSVSGDELMIKNFIGEKKPRKLKIKKGISVKVDGDKITVEHHDLQITSQTAADIEQLTKRAGFDRRKFQDGIYIIDKDGQEIV